MEEVDVQVSAPKRVWSWVGKPRPKLKRFAAHAVTAAVSSAITAAIVFPVGAGWGVVKTYQLVQDHGTWAAEQLQHASLQVRVAANTPNTLSYYMWGSGFSSKNWDAAMEEAGYAVVNVQEGEDGPVVPDKGDLIYVARGQWPGDPPDGTKTPVPPRGKK